MTRPGTLADTYGESHGQYIELYEHTETLQYHVEAAGVPVYTCSQRAWARGVYDFLAGLPAAQFDNLVNAFAASMTS